MLVLFGLTTRDRRRTETKVKGKKEIERAREGQRQKGFLFRIDF